MPLLRHLPRFADLMTAPAENAESPASFASPGQLMSRVFQLVSDHMLFCPQCSRTGAPACAESRRIWRAAFR